MNGKTSLMLIACLTLAGWAIYFILPAYVEYKKTDRLAREAGRLLLDCRQERDALAEEIMHLKLTPAAIERVARDKFNWSRPGETIYQIEYEDDDPRR